MITIHDETKAMFIEKLVTMFGTLGAEEFKQRKRLEQMEAEKEQEVELAQIRQQKSTEHPQEMDTTDSSSPVNDLQQATPHEVEQALDELVEEEMCAVCRDLLVALKQRPTRDQVRGIMEYGSFKRELDDDAGVEELRTLLQETEVLQSVMQENLTGGRGMA